MFDDFYLNVKLEYPNVIPPKRALDGSAGFDVFAPRQISIPSKGDIMVKLEIRVEFPENYGLLFLNKSGRATKDKLIVGAQLVDSDFRGILVTHLFNLGNKYVTIEKDEKVSQFIVIPIWHGQANVVDYINMETDRGEGSRGSTGLK